jgi:hypothetical protein
MSPLSLNFPETSQSIELRYTALNPSRQYTSSILHQPVCNAPRRRTQSLAVLATIAQQFNTCSQERWNGDMETNACLPTRTVSLFTERACFLGLPNTGAKLELLRVTTPSFSIIVAAAKSYNSVLQYYSCSC